jgi:hypothetical protein
MVRNVEDRFIDVVGVAVIVFVLIVPVNLALHM